MSGVPASDSLVRRVLRWPLRIALLLLLLALLWLAFMQAGSLPGSSAAQREALASLEGERTQVHGSRNAAEFMRLFEYVLDATQLAEVSAEDHRVRLGRSRSVEEDWNETVAEGEYPRLGTWSSADWQCQAWPDEDDSGCLPRIRAHLDEARALLEASRERLAKETALDGYDHVRVRTDLALFPMGPPSAGGAVALAAALDHVDGRSEAALHRLCTHIATWRSLRANNNSLITDMLGVAVLSRLLRLAAEITAEQPEAWVPACESALQPLSDAEIDQCPVFAGEFAYQRQMLGSELLGAADWGALGARLLWNQNHTELLMAQPLAWYCGPEHADRASRRSAKPTAPEVSCSPWQRAFNFAGCMLVDVGGPDLDRYYLRVLDLDAKFRLLQVARWLRAQGQAGDMALRLSRLPEDMQSPEHRLALSQDGYLELSLLDQSRTASWRIPLWQASTLVPD